MQQLIGNRAVSRLIARRADPSTFISRYTIVKTSKQKPNFWAGENAPLRVSDDGNMAVKHNNGVPADTNAFQSLYATPGILQASALALAANGSAFTIAAGTDTIQGKPPGDKNGAVRTLSKAVIGNQDLARIGKGDFTFNACTANMSNFLGVLRGLPGDNEKLERRRDIVLKLQGSLDHKKKEVVVGENFTDAMLEAREVATGTPKSKAAYNTMSESVRKQVSAQYGINESALPDVGEGWGIMQGGKGGREGMGHFAPVVAKSGEDRVTLENDVSQSTGREKPKIGDINPNWYVRMFGPVKEGFWGNTDQTFWGEAKKYEKDDFGDKPLVTALGSQAMQQDDEDD